MTSGVHKIIGQQERGDGLKEINQGCLVSLLQLSHTIFEKRISYAWSTKRSLFAKSFHG